MENKTGFIVPQEFADAFRKLDPDRWQIEYTEMMIPPTEKQLARKPPKVGRNEPCPCGSGKKFKKCCLDLPPCEHEE